MWDLLLEPVLWLFGLIWNGDERREARWFAVGCLTLVLVGIGILVWVYW